MGLRIPDVKFELNTVYKTYVDQLLLANDISKILLDNANIDAAGGQVEGSLRILLKDLLPERIAVTHGHLVDKNAAISNQQDVLIAESFYTKSLIKSLDGTEFYPIEAIFATGEVKKTWSQTKLVEASSSIRRIKNDLKRNDVASNQLSTGSNFISLTAPITSNPKRNPFFCFTFSLDYDNKYSETGLAKVYNETDRSTLPNVSIILKRGIYVMIDIEKLKNNELVIKLYPEFLGNDSNYRWIFLKLTPEESLAYLVFMLTQHINDTILEKVSSMGYAQTMINTSPTNIYPIQITK